MLEPRGKGEHQLSDDDIHEKFRQNATFSPLPKFQSERILELLGNLEKIEDMNELAIAIRGE